MPLGFLVQCLREILDTKDLLAAVLPTNYGLVASGGIVYNEDPLEEFGGIVDRANSARKRAKDSHLSTFLRCTQEMREKLEGKRP